MSEKSFVQKLTKLSEEWSAGQPLKPEDENRLWKKLCLDWNYHSNHIEGNTLTYGETELLLIHGQTHGSHELRDYEEMKAHNLAINRLRELAKENRPITEAEIRTWNEIILKEPFWTSAITPEGTPTRKRVIPGKYKNSSNSVRTATGEIFEFTAPIDVSAKMGTLVQTLNNCLSIELSSLPEILAKTHHEFLLIHPFDDGNGRVARLITNYILLSRRLLPAIIPTTEKSTYLAALRQADVGIYDSLNRYIGERICIALELGIKTMHGEEIEDIADVEKEIAIFVRDHARKKTEPVRRNFETLISLCETSFKPLFSMLDEKTIPFEKLFDMRSMFIESDTQGSTWSETLDLILASARIHRFPKDLLFVVRLDSYTRDSENRFDATSGILVEFEEFQFKVRSLGHSDDPYIIKSYSDSISRSEAEKIVQDQLKSILERIKSKTKHSRNL